MSTLRNEYNYVKQWALDHGAGSNAIHPQDIMLEGVRFGRTKFMSASHFEGGKCTSVGFFIEEIYDEYGLGYSNYTAFLKEFSKKYRFFEYAERNGSEWIQIDSKFDPETTTVVGGQIGMFIRCMREFLGNKASDVDDNPDHCDYLVAHEVKKPSGPAKKNISSGKGGSDEGSIVVGLLLGLFTSIIGLIVCAIMKKKKTWIGWVIGVVAQFAIVVIIALINPAV